MTNDEAKRIRTNTFGASDEELAAAFETTLSEVRRIRRGLRNGEPLRYETRRTHDK